MSDDVAKVCHHCDHAAASADETTCPKHDLVLVDPAEHAKDPMDPFLGRTLGGRYPIVGIIGAGGMGAVYRAIQQPVGREVALKVIRNTGDDKLAMRERFDREARVIAQLQHPNTVTLHDYGVHDESTLYMVLELIGGHPLTRKIAAGPMPEDVAASIMAGVLDALVEAHALGLVHRDLKPDNIMLADTSWGQEHVKVLDFGVAKVMGGDEAGARSLTQTGTAVGTVCYMSPEQIQGKDDLDGRSDLYSAAIILYECLRGRPPFAYINQIDLLSAHIQEKPPPLDPSLGVSPAVAAVVMRALSKRASNRFEDARSMAAALREAAGIAPPVVSGEVRVSGGVAVEVAPGPTTAELGRGEVGALAEGPQRRRAPLIAAGLVAVAAGLGLTALLGGDAPPPAPTIDAASAPEAAAPVAPAAPAAATPAPPPSPATARMLTTEPPGVEVYEDSAFVGRTPLRVDLAAGVGARQLELRLPGHGNVVTTVDRSGEANVRVKMEALAPPDPAPKAKKKRKRGKRKAKKGAKKGAGRKLLGMD